MVLRWYWGWTEVVEIALGLHGTQVLSRGWKGIVWWAAWGLYWAC